MENVRVLIDTGAFNTMIDRALAEKFATLLPDSMAISIGGKTGKAQICIIHSLTLSGGITLNRVAALAYPFDDWLLRHIILGTNVLNNWKFTISRSSDTLWFTEELPSDASNKEYPYQNFFVDSRYIAVQEINFVI
jgi:predicted aspartyl protease